MSRQDDETSADTEPRTDELVPRKGTDLNATVNLVEHVQDGRSQAWEQLAAKIENRLRGRHGHRRAYPLGYDFDDFRMDVMVRVLQGIGSYRPPAHGTFWNWLFTVAQNVLVDLRRKEQCLTRGGDWKRVQSADETDALDRIAASREDSPTTFARQRELLDAEEGCARQLSEAHREVYQLRRRGLSFAEIAEQTDKREGTLRSDYRRAKNIMLTCLSRRIDGLRDQLALLMRSSGDSP